MAQTADANPVNSGDTAWMLISSALVLLMTPGLAFFYGGLVRSRNVLNTMMMSLILMALVGVTWTLWGYSLAFDGQLCPRAISRSENYCPVNFSPQCQKGNLGAEVCLSG
jgi:ammonia channel protein AmtB